MVRMGMDGSKYIGDLLYSRQRLQRELLAVVVVMVMRMMDGCVQSLSTKLKFLAEGFEGREERNQDKRR